MGLCIWLRICPRPGRRACRIDLRLGRFVGCRCRRLVLRRARRGLGGRLRRSSFHLLRVGFHGCDSLVSGVSFMALLFRVCVVNSRNGPSSLGRPVNFTLKTMPPPWFSE